MRSKDLEKSKIYYVIDGVNYQGWFVQDKTFGYADEVALLMSEQGESVQVPFRQIFATNQEALEYIRKEKRKGRKKISREERVLVHSKYGGHCAYCGAKITLSQMQVDHIVPIRAGGNNELANYNPSCARCNKRKDGNPIEVFRKEISLQVERLRRDSRQFRLAEDFGLIQETYKPVTFYCDTHKSFI